MSYTGLPMDFSQAAVAASSAQKQYPQVYDYTTSPFGYHSEMQVFGRHYGVNQQQAEHQQQQPSLEDIQNQEAYWRLQVPLHADQLGWENDRPLGPNGKPKRRRTATHAQRRAANVRERRRMFSLNESFDQLRTRVPTFAYEKRLSRIETLRLAITYISFLNQVIDGAQPEEVNLLACPRSSELSPVNMAVGKREENMDYFDQVSRDNSTSD